MKQRYLFLFLILISTVARAQNHTLDDFVQSAIKNSPLIRDLNNQILAGQIDSVRLRAGFRPQITGSVMGLYAPVIKSYGYSTAITNGQQLTGLVTIDKQFIGKGYLNAQLLSILNQKDSIKNTIRLSEQDLRKTIAAQYITAYGSQEQQRFNAEIVQLLTKEEQVLLKLTRSNVYRQSDYLTFLVTLKQAELQKKQAELQYKADYSTLKYLAGMRDTVLDTLSRPDIRNTLLADRSSSIFFKQFQLDSVRIKNAHQLIDYSYKPKFHLFVDGGYNSDLTVDYYKNLGASAGFGLSIPIYDGGQRKLAHRKIQLEENTRQQYKQFFEQQYSQQIYQLKDQIKGYDQLLADIKSQFKYSESLIKVDTKLMQTGDLKIADLILAINNYLSTKNLLTTNLIAQLQLINQLNYWNK
ncbi:TolC family protein [Mucilaginibacter conchicola]|uniref:TolC family protein n=1 Tax=Mucilaginibacter conchicola TaxID=2303333 RepID=A0A372NZP3_9SPHI|nr:TolC family protein [Mucilaginibacter conchicola]RFZ95586.1 TolC family protein [Mucilaginibacter conchicola]